MGPRAAARGACAAVRCSPSVVRCIVHVAHDRQRACVHASARVAHHAVLHVVCRSFCAAHRMLLAVPLVWAAVAHCAAVSADISHLVRMRRTALAQHCAACNVQVPTLCKKRAARHANDPCERCIVRRTDRPATSGQDATSGCLFACSGFAILANTSFNIKGKPIVNRIDYAIQVGAPPRALPLGVRAAVLPQRLWHPHLVPQRH